MFASPPHRSCVAPPSELRRALSELRRALSELRRAPPLQPFDFKRFFECFSPSTFFLPSLYPKPPVDKSRLI